MHVTLLFRKIEHHAGHSGYDQLVKHVPGNPYQRGLLYGLFSRMPEKLIRRVKVFNSDWYRRESLFAELSIVCRNLLPGRRLYHFLYGEDAVRLSSRTWRWGQKIVASFHQPPEVLNEKFSQQPYIRKLDAVIALCEEQERWFHQHLSPQKVFRVPHGVDTGFWCPDPTGKRASPPTFLHVGWWLRDLEAFKATVRQVHGKDPRVRFRVVTFPHLFEHYRDLPNVDLLTGISDEALRDEYRRATALLLPLKAVTANNAVLESLACGTPVISTAHGGLPEYVDDQCALKAPLGDADTLSRFVLELAGDARKVQAMGVAARARSARYDWAAVGEQMAYVYARVLGVPTQAAYHQDRKEPRNICLMSDEYPPETGWGGIATYNRNLAEGLAAAGHNVYVISSCVENPSVEKRGNLEIHRVKFHPRTKFGQRVWWHWIQPFLRKRCIEFLRRIEFGLAARKRFRFLRDRIPMHVVESPEYYGSTWFLRGKLRSCPVIVKLHTPTEVNCHINSQPVSRDVRLSNIFEKGAVRKATRVHSPSRKMIEIVQQIWIKDLRDVDLLEYPIDAGKYGFGKGWQGPTKNFLFTGRLEKRKGVDLMVKAFDTLHDLDDVELLIAGHDTPTFALDGKNVPFQELLPTLGLRQKTLARIRFLGRKPLDELIPLYQSAYACVIPSTSFENFPNSCLEALACGKPVIVSDKGGMVEMAPHEVAGLHFRAGDVEDLARALRRFATDPAMVARCGKAARRIVEERYHTPIMIDKIVASYEKLIASARYR